MKRHVFTVATIDDLAAELRKYDVVVPPRAKGRTCDHVERYSIVRLIGTISWKYSDFPMTLYKSERPDYVLDCNGQLVGIELTETLTENAGKEAALRSQGHGPDLHYVRPMSLSEPRKASKELRLEIEENKPSGGFYGDSVERSWVEAMRHFVGQKLSSATKAGFLRCSETWLLMYDAWNAPGLHREKSVASLESGLREDNPWSTFDRIFILDSKILIEAAQDRTWLVSVQNPEPIDDGPDCDATET